MNKTLLLILLSLCLATIAYSAGAAPDPSTGVDGKWLVGTIVVALFSLSQALIVHILTGIKTDHKTSTQELKESIKGLWLRADDHAHSVEIEGHCQYTCRAKTTGVIPHKT